jgi:hypothetical protein
VIGVAGESFFGIRHWWNSRKLQAIQNAENDKQRAEIARLDKEAEHARQAAAEAIARAADLQKQAEHEKSARLKIEERMAWRRIGAKDHDALVEQLRSHPRSDHRINRA